ncbi:MAG: hypothetical protein AUK44_09095 [Porphyromonadaceae bacterium CG2_30_38_12]|nr:MAG: hypothetical protein AUK44_09095 [Porphyromonadaceae bacterium CG2_30_38_12]
MKRYSTSLFLFALSALVYGQFTATGTYKCYEKTYPGIEYLFVFDGMDSISAIRYNGINYSTIKWYSFNNQTTPIVLQDQTENINIEDATGYIVEVDGVRSTIWVIDYSKYLPVFAALTPEDKPKEQCDGMNLIFDGNIPPMYYETPDLVKHNIVRYFSLQYNTKVWSDKQWIDKQISETIETPTTPILIVNPPLCDTQFTLQGDSFATDLGRTLQKIESPSYRAVKVEGHITSKTSIRNELNEAERPSTAEIIDGSAPLEIIFQSNANTPTAEFYQWEIYKDGSLLFSRTDQDLRYTFTEAGTFKVRLTVSNANCENSDSITVKVSESAIEVPRVFTPNGDGINDEFRVAYKSITSFKCWVFNRWQQKIYAWTDPQKGWDGKINGKPANTGAYFYIIEAVGSDGIKYNLKGNINLLRSNQ